jgi:FtsP/CotA-like multicopper oxidase with cupredoxin domain
MSTTSDHFPTEVAGLPEARASELVELGDGDELDLRIAPVAKRLGDHTVRMLAYNGSIPGPTLKVREGSEVVVNVENEGDIEATVHWHGLRLDNRYDGTQATQKPIEIGERFEYRLEFPDPGAYWYHPHIRQDYGQEMGLYGNILVVPADPGYWPPAHRELLVALDDVLIEDGRVAPFDPRHTTYSAMGRFGNVILINGEPEMHLSARRGEVVRFYLTNTANTRVFNFAVHVARMKLVGGDSGRCEHEEFVESVIVSPSERVVVDVLFDAAGAAALEHRTPWMWNGWCIGWSDSISLTRRIFTWSPTVNRQLMSVPAAPVSRSTSFQRVLAGVVPLFTSTMSSSHSMAPAACPCSSPSAWP